MTWSLLDSPCFVVRISLPQPHTVTHSSTGDEHGVQKILDEQILLIQKVECHWLLICRYQNFLDEQILLIHMLLEHLLSDATTLKVSNTLQYIWMPKAARRVQQWSGHLNSTLIYFTKILSFCEPSDKFLSVEWYLF